MKLSKKALSIAVTAALGVAGGLGAAQAATVTLTFANNATPDTNPQFVAQTGSTAGSGIAFAPNTEFRVLTPGGTKFNNGQKDVISGGETWTFTNGVLTAVGGTAGNPGSGTGTTNRAPITSSLSGFPKCTGANTCAGLQQNASFLQSFLPFGMIAPVAGSVAGNTYGPGTETMSSTSMTINMPVIQTEWANGNYIIGADPNPTTGGDVFSKGAGPGVTFHAVLTPTGTNTGTFDIHASYMMTADEVAVAGFANNFVQWELKGTYAVTGAAPVPIPAAAWLFGSGLIGLVGIARRKKGLG